MGERKMAEIWVRLSHKPIAFFKKNQPVQEMPNADKSQASGS